MTSEQIKELKETMHKEFESIYELCYFIMKSYVENPNQVKTSLIESCINTLHAFLSWIPLGYIFLTDLIDIILQLFEFKELKPLALKCLIEIVILSVDGCSDEEGKKIKEQIFKLYSNFIYKLSNFIPSEVSLQQERIKLENQKSQNLATFDHFCNQLTLFFAGFLKTHLSWIEPLANNSSNPDQSAVIDLIKKGFAYLIQLSQLPDQIFKICVDYWYEFTSYLLKNRKIFCT
jgi:exportin-1